MYTLWAPDWAGFGMFLVEFPVFAGADVRFESHFGHVFSLCRGLRASECAQVVHLGIFC
ncbi:hypothetical protein ABIB14_003079 [Arthrobacter sp. UYEF3]